ncbi:MAG: hypothetical protein GY703_24475 [Gammaproteobacteria bacterium]|nr:hypothetical protein [Gammaproteobacteria bacterium]
MADMRFSDFNVEIAGSQLLEGQVLPATPDDRYAIKQSLACPACGDQGVLPARLFSLTPDAGQGLHSDGSVMVAIAELGENAAWGPDDGTDYMFERTGDADLPGILALPGFVVQGTADLDTSVSEVLLGMRAATSNGSVLFPDQLYPLNTSEARQGNYFMAGLNVGPERLVDANGDPEVGLGSDLSGRPTRIGFGSSSVPDFESVAADAGSKYVIREAGVTGVFGAQNIPQPDIYGYDLNLERFAFRQINNAIDPENWMERTPYLPPPADLKVAFSSMRLRCSGDVDGGRLTFETCDNDIDDNGNGLVDENCMENLLAWQTDYLLKGASFVPVDPLLGACDAQSRELQTWGIASINALDSSTTLTARWSPGGQPNNAFITGKTNHKLDRPAVDNGSDEDHAFDLALDSGIEMDLNVTGDRGWYGASGLLGLYFWEDVEIDLRLQNRTTQEPEQTLVFVRDSLQDITGQAQTDNSNADLIRQMSLTNVTHSSAHYDWVGGIDFDLPVYYDAGRYDQNRQPRFVGPVVAGGLSLFDGQMGQVYSDLSLLISLQQQLCTPGGVSYDQVQCAGTRIALSTLVQTGGLLQTVASRLRNALGQLAGVSRAHEKIQSILTKVQNFKALPVVMELAGFDGLQVVQARAAFIDFEISDQILDVVFRVDTAFGDSAKLFGSPVAIDSLFGRITLQSGEPIGYAGGIGIQGSPFFELFGLNDPQLVIGGQPYQALLQCQPGPAVSARR